MSDSVEAGALKLGDTVVGSPASAETAAPVDTPGSALDIEAFRRGDAECFRVLVKRFGPLIKHIAQSYTKDRDQQDDLYQEACVRLLTQRARYDERGALRGWITRLAHSCCRNRCAARAVRKAALDRYGAQLIPVEESDALVDDPTRLLNYRTFMRALERALAAIPSRQAEAFSLVHIEGHTPAKAARILNVSAATIRSNIRYAREKLREELEDARDALS